jgi:hypothetical protein
LTAWLVSVGVIILRHFFGYRELSEGAGVECAGAAFLYGTDAMARTAAWTISKEAI